MLSVTFDPFSGFVTVKTLVPMLARLDCKTVPTKVVVTLELAVATSVVALMTAEALPEIDVTAVPTIDVVKLENPVAVAVMVVAVAFVRVVMLATVVTLAGMNGIPLSFVTAEVE